jgi:GT2 family glycosyltransferase
VEAAAGEVILFLGDDTVPEPRWLAEHLQRHRLHPAGSVAVLGYTSFPIHEDSPFLRWINEFGAQFGYLLIEDPGQVPFNFFYTSNISLPRSTFVEHGGFREDFPAAAWEDIEFAYRATAAGMRIVYQPRARTVHHHRIRPGTFCRRQRTAGRSAAIFAELHPELADFLGVNRLASERRVPKALQMLLLALVHLGDHVPGVIPEAVTKRLLDAAYLEGLAGALHSHGRR